MLSLSKKFLFLHVPKTAGNSIQRFLKDYSEDNLVRTAPYQDGVNRFEVRSSLIKITKHSRLIEYQSQLDEDLYKSLFKFACVRNPWDRCVSHFFSPHRGDVVWDESAFEAYIVNHVHAIQHYVQLPGSDSDLGNIDAYVRFEHLEEDFNRVCRKIGLSICELPRVNFSRRAPYREYFQNDRLVELVAQKFKIEINEFGYQF